jgi:hypothetical protein
MTVKPAQTGGSENAIAALKNVLATQGVTAPHTGQPFSEAMLLGIGGGLGAGYILWEFKEHGSANLVLGFRNRWNYVPQHLATLCERIGAVTAIQETGSAKAANANFQTALDAGQPFIAWVDKASLPYQHLPESLKGYGIWLVGVYGVENGAVQVDDLGEGLYSVPLDTFTAARGVIPSDKNRIMRVDVPSQIDLPGAIQAGIADGVEHMSSTSESFAPPVYKKWAKMMTDKKNKKGWPVVFAERLGLFDALCSVYEGVKLDNTEGCGLRGLYADFLEEASEVVNRPALKQVAQQYRDLAGLWTRLADAALPAHVPAFQQARDLLEKRYHLLRAHQFDELRAVSDQIVALRATYKRDFPIDDDVDALFIDMSSQLSAIYDAEISAVESLKQTLN